MKPLEEQDPYEVLEVSTNATMEEIERAYELIRAAYEEGSLALYSVFGNQDAEAIRNRIDQAYQALKEKHSQASLEEHDEDREKSSAQALGATDGDDTRLSTPAAELPGTIDVFENLDAEVNEEQEEFDGAALRRARLRRGIELEQIAIVTKVGSSYLRCIEDENFADLPASVYVRGFVTAYARAIGLNPQRVAASYMPRVDEARRRPQRFGMVGLS